MNRLKFVDLIKWALLAAGLGAVVGCSDDDGPVEASSQDTLVLMFEEKDDGMDPYATRMLVNQDYLRIDEGRVDSDFTLLDRKEGVIYSVSHFNRMALVIRAEAIKVEMPIPITLDARKQVDKKAPEINGKQPIHYSLLVNGESCRELIVVENMHPRALKALREFRRILSGVHARNLHKTPVEMQDPCFLAHDVMAPVRTLQYGFPIQEWDSSGYSRSLVGYENQQQVNPDLFEVPTHYLRRDLDATSPQTDT